MRNAKNSDLLFVAAMLLVVIMVAWYFLTQEFCETVIVGPEVIGSFFYQNELKRICEAPILQVNPLVRAVGMLTLVIASLFAFIGVFIVDWKERTNRYGR